MSKKTIPIGMASIDITPTEPIRLSGYGVRREETARIETPLYAKALAIGNDKPVVLLTLENCGVTNTFTSHVAKRLKEATGLERNQIVICYSHTHTAPCLTNAVPMLFSTDIPAAHQAAIDRYTEKLADQLVEVGLAALANRSPGHLSYATGHVGFAGNRRSQIGPVDHVLPVLRITDPDGQLRGLWLSYACHCTTLSADDNAICGDWAGHAQTLIENANPGVTAFVSIGCAADANPFPRPGLEYVRQHGQDIVYEVNRLLNTQPFTPLNDTIQTAIRWIVLPFDTLPTRDEWQAKASEDSPIGYHAGKWLSVLERGDSIPTTHSYPIQTWTFGEDLSMIFLAGEVVSDYTYHLRRLYDPHRLWVGAYANAFPGYIPSKRVWQEGGYEGGGATVYFGLPNRFDEHIETLIIDTIQEMVPASYRRVD